MTKSLIIERETKLISDTSTQENSTETTKYDDNSLPINAILVNGHKYRKEILLQFSDDYSTYRVRDDIRREFTLKVFNHPESKEFIETMKKLRGKQCVASIVEYEILQDKILIIFESGKPIKTQDIQKNLIKRRLRQVITAAGSIAEANLNFSNLHLNDFIDTNGGFRLIHFESTYQTPPDPSITTFAPLVPILTEILEGKKADLDSEDISSIQKSITLAGKTEIQNLKQLLNSDTMRDGFRVVINKGNRSATPDPHNLVPFKRRRHRQVILDYEDEEEPILIKRIEPGDVPSFTYLIFLSLGVIFSLIESIYIKLTIKLSYSFTYLMARTSLFICAVCGAILALTLKNYSVENPPISLTSKLKKWCLFLNGYVIVMIGIKSLEFNYEIITSAGAFVLMVWLLSSFIIA
ncbi:hypothetical protein TVAG_246660 [Trichomonas vaginalis G3]|uniref:Uncharacterized protein n=1 Tax=Trichomonas vaginalis (strain ATCC PRA-98 / G3) TaxID=412133 RepID=A2DKK5_TRIV3|nr:hypothetical protein TVAGG3_0561370 [Trichomonas vaginalis G3]EAY18988.1 hypothetical protein TVAG_246660 [Trichomonas vaginalis G3]KAI5521219.1 hypothetical protein TVAGG3_0561370 [Trichomonas vaginalis G3]|eukprot:XP_001579974.1 hypothetical protein [Trichomonas vaginalis G3]